MKSKRKIFRRLDVMFSLIVFMVLIFTVFILGFIMMSIHRLGLVESRTPLYIASILVVSILLGVLFSRYISRSFIRSIQMMTEATKEVAKGNFNVCLSEKHMIEEIEVMSKNFNRMTQELSKIDTLSHEFINNISHEFKTPVSAIEGYATLLQNTTLTEETAKEYRSRILYNTKRLTTLTTNILELSRLEHQNLASQRHLFQLDEQIREVILSQESRWLEKDLDILIDLDDITYYGAEYMLVHVWENLISNAIKFVEPKGLIDIRLKKDNGNIIFNIKDNGIGIEEKNQDRIFERFYQEESAHSTPGNGLGLSLVSKIVYLEGGEITLKSKKDLGTEINVILKEHEYEKTH